MTRQFSIANDAIIDPGATGAAAALQLLYDNSPTIAALLDKMASNNIVLRINFVPGKFSSTGVGGGPILLTEEHVRLFAQVTPYPAYAPAEIAGTLPTPTINLDPNYIVNNWYIDDAGFGHRMSLARAIGHEILHLLAATSDNKASYLAESNSDFQGARNWLGKPEADFRGDTITGYGTGLFGTGENGIGAQLSGSDAWVRASYQDAVVGAEFDSVFAKDISLTDGNYVQDVFVDWMGTTESTAKKLAEQS